MAPRESHDVVETLHEQEQVACVRQRSRAGATLSAYALGGGFAAVAVVLALLSPPHLDGDLAGRIAALVAAYAIAFRVRFEAGPGSAVATQLVFVPMLFALPLAVVPAATGAAILVAAVWDPGACACPTRQRPFVLLAGAWYSLGAVAVLTAAGGHPAPATSWGVLLLAFAAQCFADAAAQSLRAHVALGYPLRPLALALSSSYLIDVTLTATAFTIVHLGAGAAATVAGLAPLGLLLAGVARERRSHLQRAVALGGAYRAAADRARVDVLTGLANRLAWDEALGEAARHDGAVTVVLLDANDLKLANDGRGHAFGDRLIVEIGTLLREAAPGAHAVARLGGDEFGALFLDLRPAEVARTVSDMRATFAAHPGIDGFAVSVAIGCASTPPAADLEQALADADAAVYHDKRGRRRPSAA